MACVSPRLALLLGTALLASACEAENGADQAEDEQRPDGSSGSGTSATGGAGNAAGSGGASGASNAGRGGRGGGSSGSSGTPAGDGGQAGENGGAGNGSAGNGGAGNGDAGAGTGGAGGKAGATAGSSGGLAAGTAECPKGLAGPALVNVPAPDESAASSYCMDATEVTNAQYAAFLAASVTATGQAEACAWNASYTPARDWPATGKDDHPVAHVDWCDAYAYCKWAGKHLCGKIGGGTNDFDFDYDDAAMSEWFNACSAGDMSAYPYGDEYNATACVGFDFEQPGYQPAVDVARAVGTPKCEGGYRGLRDLSGNVAEWEDSCDGEAADDPCRLRGGSFGADMTGLKCDHNSDREREFVSPSVGFRCCADAMD